MTPQSLLDVVEDLANVAAPSVVAFSALGEDGETTNRVAISKPDRELTHNELITLLAGLRLNYLIALQQAADLLNMPTDVVQSRVETFADRVRFTSE